MSGHIQGTALFEPALAAGSSILRFSSVASTAGTRHHPPFARTALAVALISMGSTVWAEAPQDARINPVVVSASAFPKTQSETLQSTTVFTREDIERSAARSVAELLQGSAGFEFARTGGAGTTTSFFIRGQNSSNIAVIVDGVRQQVDAIGFPSFLDLPLSMLERVELIRGGLSSLYGEAAIGGVLVIQTRPELDGGRISLGLGTRNRRQASLSFQKQAYERVTLGVQVSEERDAGFSARTPGSGPEVNPDNDPSRVRFGGLNLGVKLAEGHQLRAGLKSIENRVGIDEGFSFQASERDKYREFRQTLQEQQLVYAGQLSSGVGLDLQTVRSDLRYLDTRDGVPVSGFENGRVRGVQTSQLARLSSDLPFGFKAAIGLDQKAAKFETSSGTQLDRDQFGRSLSLLGSQGLLSAEASVRRDEINNKSVNDGILVTAGSPGKRAQNSSQLGLGVQLASQLRLLASQSRSFRLPALGELFATGGEGNPDLRPERSASREAGFVWSTDRFQARLVRFASQTNDAIAYSFDTFRLENIPLTKNNGYELQSKWLWSGFRLGVDATFQDPRNDQTNEPLARRARRFGALSLGTSVSGTDIEFRLIGSSGRADKDPNPFGPQQRTSGYGLANLTLRRAVTKDADLALKFENLFDRQVETVKGYQSAPFGVMVTGTQRF